MKNLLLLVFFTSFLFLTQAASDVVVLTKKNYDDVLKKNEFVFIEYYAPWCGHCKQLAPEYEKVATSLKGKVVVAKVDADSERELGEKAGIKGFPTLKLYKGGKLYKDYQGARTSPAITNWLKKKTGPVATLLKTQKDLDAFVKENKKALVGFFKSTEGADYKEFIKNVDEDKTFGDFPAGYVVDAALTKAATGGDAPALKLFRDFDDKALVSKDLKNAKKWLLGNGYPLVEEIGAENFQRYVDSGLKLAVAFINTKDAKTKKETLAIITKVAQAVKGKLSWGYSDGVTYKDQISAMGADATKLPAIAAMDIHKRLNYPYKGAFNEKDLEKWSQGLVDGSVEPFYKSQPIPKEQKTADIVIVGKSFKDIVYDKTKDVLVEFYAPWCGHCKSLAPKYTKLAGLLKGNKNLVIGKVDATENDTPIQVEGFPTIYFFPSNNKDKPIQYQGARTVKGLQDFLSKNGVASKVKGGEKKGEEKVKKDEL